MAVRSSLVAILISSVTACGVSHEHRAHATLGGGALAIAGLVIARPRAVDSDLNGRNDNFLNDDYSGVIPGTLMVIGGLALLIAGLSAREPIEPIESPPPVLARQLAPKKSSYFAS